MKMRFTLEVTLGNDECRTVAELEHVIAQAICQVRLAHHNDGGAEVVRQTIHTVRDVNGNTVGSWQVKP
jgi:hypothetical protein